MVLRSNGGFPDALRDGTGRAARSVCGDVDRRASNSVFNQCGASFVAPEFRLDSVSKILLKPMIGTVSTIRSVASSRRRFNRRARPARRD